MELSDWAEEHAWALLSPLGERWRHAQAVADAARELAQQLDQNDGDALIASAYLHDKPVTSAVSRQIRGSKLQRLSPNSPFGIRVLGAHRLALFCVILHPRAYFLPTFLCNSEPSERAERPPASPSR